MISQPPIPTRKDRNRGRFPGGVAGARPSERPVEPELAVNGRSRKFRHRRGEIPQDPARQTECQRRNGKTPGFRGHASLVLFLPPPGYECRVFRAALLSIVLSLAVGQNVALLCRAWCQARVAAASGCHHEGAPSTPSVAGDKDCDNAVVAAATAILKEDVRRDVSSPGANHTIRVPRYQLAQLPIDTRQNQEAGRGWLLGNRPLSTALRI